MNLHPAAAVPRHQRLLALTMAGTTGLVLLALSHHPVAGNANSFQESLARIAALQARDGLVHGVLIVMLAVLAGGLYMFGALLGGRRPAVVAAMAAYLGACCALVAAMLMDGFVVPQLARQFLAAPQADIDMAHLVLRVIGIFIQVLSKAGLLMMCAALLAWSYALATSAWLPRRWRWGAGLGFVAGLAPAVYLCAADMRLSPASLMAIFACHALWNILAATMLYRLSSEQHGSAMHFSYASAQKKHSLMARAAK
ncbi:hypothetical protein LJR289_001091 [Pseudoduganella sp. LjRoot289]|uniref:hypothetical protein n=1 Tax=Pseudoduganella sp. LjRoot289 TaxID=3342314 RepID=UPI003ECC5856